MLNEELKILKKKARNDFKAMRDAVVPDPQFADDLKKNFFSNVKLSNTTLISSYMPIKSEIDVRPLNHELIKRGHVLLMPFEDKAQDVLIFKKCCLKEGALVVEENILEPEILIVPLLSFDKRLMRLGYGGGWYDKTIASFSKKKLLVGVAYKVQFSFDLLPSDDFDRLLDIIITEDQAYIASSP